MPGWINPVAYGYQSRQWLGHTFRYYLAKGFVNEYDNVLDVACGTGYGSAFLASIASGVTAIDIDIEALKIAHKQWPRTNIEYVQMDLCEIDKLPDCTVAVSFETIEHLGCPPEHFVGMLKAATRNLIILSAPVIPTVHANPHHEHDFTEGELQGLILDEEWILWEKIRQGPYMIIVAYRK